MMTDCGLMSGLNAEVGTPCGNRPLPVLLRAEVVASFIAGAVDLADLFARGGETSEARQAAVLRQVSGKNAGAEVATAHTVEDSGAAHVPAEQEEVVPGGEQPEARLAESAKDAPDHDKHVEREEFPAVQSAQTGEELWEPGGDLPATGMWVRSPAMRDGTSAAGMLGIGRGAVGRIADIFQIHSRTG